MGFETAFFCPPIELALVQRETIVVGPISSVHQAILLLGNSLPVELDYPDELRDYLGRKVWRSTINKVACQPEAWNIFVKPARSAKKFTGRAIRTTKDLTGCGDSNRDVDVWCSELVELESEWRCFVRYGKILDVRPYKGDWRITPRYSLIESAVRDFRSAPAGYAIDFGITKQGQTVLVEANDGFSLGHYGLFYLDYAKLLSARWAELMQTNDPCDFDRA